MAGYIVADIDIKDPDEYQKYAQLTAGTLELYGGKFLVRGGQPETIEGDWKAKRVVILEFPSVEQAKTWYNSPEYTAIMGMRHRSTISNIIIVHGV
ncbi:MAG: DUF1330 domain-containing protein [Ktedonobacteraceae bacterium]